MRRWIRAPGVATALLVAAALLAAPAVEGERILEKDEALIERRVIPGSHINEIWVTAHSPLVPAAVFETIWEQEEHLEFVPFLKRLNLLSTNWHIVENAQRMDRPGSPSGPWLAMSRQT